MIRVFEVENFGPYQGFAFSVFTSNCKKKHKTYRRGAYGDNVSKIAGFIGGNASGKTGFIRGLAFLREFIIGRDEADSVMMTPNRKRPDCPTRFYLEFETGGRVFMYDLAACNGIVLTETLRADTCAPPHDFRLIVHRERDRVTYSTGGYRFTSGLKKSAIPQCTVNDGCDLLYLVTRYFTNMLTNVGQNSNGFGNYPAMAFQRSSPLRAKVKKCFKYMALPIKSVLSNSGPIVGNGTTTGGCVNAFPVVTSIISGIAKNKTILIDDIDAGLHDDTVGLMLLHITKLLPKSEAQLIFTSNSAGAMHALRKHQIFFAEYENCKSTIHKMTQAKIEVEEVENFFRLYFSNKYGGRQKSDLVPGGHNWLGGRW